MKGALATHRRLTAAGLTADQARSFVRLLTEAEAGRFDQGEVRKAVAEAGCSPAQAGIVIEELLERLARHAREAK